MEQQDVSNVKNTLAITSYGGQRLGGSWDERLEDRNFFGHDKNIDESNNCLLLAYLLSFFFLFFRSPLSPSLLLCHWTGRDSHKPFGKSYGKSYELVVV